MAEENPFGKITSLDELREILDKVELERLVFNEIVGDNWKVRIVETRASKEGQEEVRRIYGIQLGDKTAAVSVTSDGKLVHAVLSDVKVVSETDQTVRKRGVMLLLDYENQKLVYTETEMELWKGKTGFDAIKSISVLKSEVRELK